MKIGVYDIINDPLPQLFLIKEIEVKKSDFEYDEDIVGLLNKHLKLDKLNSEHIYALGLTFGMIPKGIIQVSVGNHRKTIDNIRGMLTGLLLIGAEQFMCFHNHPGGNKKVSMADRILTNKYVESGDLIGIDFIRHLMITKDYYCVCKEV